MTLMANSLKIDYHLTACDSVICLVSPAVPTTSSAIWGSSSMRYSSSQVKSSTGLLLTAVIRSFNCNPAWAASPLRVSDETIQPLPMSVRFLKSKS